MQNSCKTSIYSKIYRNPPIGKRYLEASCFFCVKAYVVTSIIAFQCRRRICFNGSDESVRRANKFIHNVMTSKTNLFKF